MKNIVAGLIVTFIGVSGLLVALGFGGERIWFLSRAESTVGTVVSVGSRATFGARHTQYPIVQFTTRTGAVHQVEGPSTFGHRVGQRVNLYYLRDNPQVTRLDQFVSQWLGVTIGAGVAVLFLPFAVVLLITGVRQRRREALRTRGVMVVGTVVRVEDSNVEVWGKTVQYLTLEAADPTTGAIRHFKSHTVPGNGDQWMAKQLNVYVDPKNPKRFLVDAPSP